MRSEPEVTAVSLHARHCGGKETGSVRGGSTPSGF